MEGKLIKATKHIAVDAASRTGSTYLQIEIPWEGTEEIGLCCICPFFAVFPKQLHLDPVRTWVGFWSGIAWLLSCLFIHAQRAELWSEMSKWPQDWFFKARLNTV